MEYSKFSPWIVMATFFTTSLFIPKAQAVWQQGQATVILDGADVESARVQAIKNAVANASFQYGSVVAAEDIVLDGLLVSSKSVITTQGNIQRVEIVSETILDDTLSVVVRVDISALFRLCV